jgi:hypothetical protein
MLNRRFNLDAEEKLIVCFILALIVAAIIFTYVAAPNSPMIKLSLFERLVCMSFLPKEDSFITLRIIRDLQRELAPTEKEIKLAGLERLPDGIIRAKDWFAVKEKEIVFFSTTRKFIIDALRNLDEAERLPNEYYTLYEKFIKDPERKGEL